MKLMHEFYDRIETVRKQIIQTMKERGLTEVVILEDRDEWLAEDDDRDEDEYEELKCDECPEVTYYDKHGCGYLYSITKVILEKSTAGDDTFKLVGDTDELGCETFYDHDISLMDMMLVLDTIGNKLELECQRKKNDVTSFFYYMWNAWSQDECKKVYGELWEHFWNNWIYFCKTYGVHGAAERLYAELSDGNRNKLVARATELYDGAERLKD